MGKTATHDDEILVGKLIKGDQKAFSELFGKYAANLLSVARKYVASREDAREIVQETFYRVWKYRENMNAQLSFKAYIVTIAKRLIFNQTKKRLHEIAYQEYFAKNQSAEKNTIEEYIDFNELDRKIQAGIDSMPARRKEIFLLSRGEGHTNQDIADKLNISVSTVENQMNKALKYLREHITLFSLIYYVISF